MTDPIADVFEGSISPTSGHPERYVLRLYVAGMTARSTEAVAAIKAVCEEYLQDRYELEVIDVYQHATLAKHERIIAAPTLVKKLPLPRRRLIGNLANKERLLQGLDLRSTPSSSS